MWLIIGAAAVWRGRKMTFRYAPIAHRRRIHLEPGETTTIAVAVPCKCVDVEFLPLVMYGAERAYMTLAVRDSVGATKGAGALEHTGERKPTKIVAYGLIPAKYPIRLEFTSTRSTAFDGEITVTGYA